MEQKDKLIEELKNELWIAGREDDRIHLSAECLMHSSSQDNAGTFDECLSRNADAVFTELHPLERKASAPNGTNYILRNQINIGCEDVPYPAPEGSDFTFIDLFAGIGGFRIAFQSAGGKCVFTSEWDKYAQKTYEANFGECPLGDIRKIPKNEIPDHNILCAGFPCQPFSIAGVSKKNSLGRAHGFKDETQGTLFFEIKEILRLKRPKAFMLENVKNLLTHDQGRTFEVIRQSLEDHLGYTVNWAVVDGGKWVPQHRERVFIVGFDPKQVRIDKKEIKIPTVPVEGHSYPELMDIIGKTGEGCTLGPGTWATLLRHKAHHASKGNGLYPFVRVLCYAAFTTVCNSNCAGAKYPNVECSLTLL